MRVGIATDHGGFSLKEELTARLRAAGHEIVDFGAYALDPADDYPDFVVPLAEAVVAGGGAARRGDLRQRCRRVRLRQQGLGHTGGARARPLLRRPGRRRRSPEYPLHGRTHGRPCRRVGSREGVPRRRVQHGRSASAPPGQSDTAGNIAGQRPKGSAMTTTAPPTEAQLEQLAINTIRTLSMDAVQAANSGHPGTRDGARAAGLHHLEPDDAVRS